MAAGYWHQRRGGKSAVSAGSRNPRLDQDPERNGAAPAAATVTPSQTAAAAAVGDVAELTAAAAPAVPVAIPPRAAAAVAAGCEHAAELSAARPTLGAAVSATPSQTAAKDPGYSDDGPKERLEGADIEKGKSEPERRSTKALSEVCSTRNAFRIVGARRTNLRADLASPSVELSRVMISSAEFGSRRNPPGQIMGMCGSALDISLTLQP